VNTAEDVEGESKRMEECEGETDRNGTQRYRTIQNLDHNHRGLLKGKCKVLQSRSDAEAFDAAIVVPQNGDAIPKGNASDA
jgi:hypothetical protein